MKVFWSWQSDTPGRTGRHFVRDCLQAAVGLINAERNEASELEVAAREDLELDHDRKGVKGSPGLADTIYAKIREAAVVVCDVTPVAELVAGDGRVKKLTNPNVAIELGYAQGTRGDERVLMVLNLVYGRHEELAFDLRHKTGILTYTLADDAERVAIRAEAKTFTALLVEALRPYAEAPAAPAEPPAPFVRAASTTDPARWWEPEEVLGHRGRDGAELIGPAGPLLYLRLSPETSVLPIGQADLRESARHFSTFDGGFNVGRNRYGTVLLHHVGGDDEDPLQVWSATQLFESGEVWAVEAHLLRDEPGRGPGWPFVPIGAVERQTYRLFRETARAMLDHFHTPLPIEVEFGMAPAKDFRIPLSGKQWFSGRSWSAECYDEAIELRGVLPAVDDESIDACLLGLLERFWDRFGERRPTEMPIGGYR